MDYRFRDAYTKENIDEETVEDILKKIVDEEDDGNTMVEYLLHRNARFDMKSAERYMEHCAGMHATSSAYEDCMKLYEDGQV